MGFDDLITILILEFEKDKYFILFFSLKDSAMESKKYLLKLQSFKIRVFNLGLFVINVFIKFSSLAFFGSK